MGLSLSWREGQVIFCQRSVRSRNTKASVSGDWDLRHRDRKKNNHQSQPETAWVEIPHRTTPARLSQQTRHFNFGEILVVETDGYRLWGPRESEEMVWAGDTQGVTSSWSQLAPEVVSPSNRERVPKIMGLRDDLTEVVTVRKWGYINTFLKSWGWGMTLTTSLR